MSTVKPILFTNFSERAFTGRHNGQNHVIQAGQSIWLPGELACHLAKHLSDRELTVRGAQVTDPLKTQIIKKISPDLEWNDGKHFVKVSGEIGTLSQVDQQIAMLNRVDAIEAFESKEVTLPMEISPPVETTPTITVEVVANPPAKEKPKKKGMPKGGWPKKEAPMEVEFEGVNNP